MGQAAISEDSMDNCCFHAVLEHLLGHSDCFCKSNAGLAGLVHQWHLLCSCANSILLLPSEKHTINVTTHDQKESYVAAATRNPATWKPFWDSYRLGHFHDIGIAPLIMARTKVDDFSLIFRGGKEHNIKKENSCKAPVKG